MIARSNSTNTPIIWYVARPDGVDVSRPPLVQVGIDPFGTEIA
jgi:hypothetical protein